MKPKTKRIYSVKSVNQETLRGSVLAKFTDRDDALAYSASRRASSVVGSACGFNIYTTSRLVQEGSW